MRTPLFVDCEERLLVFPSAGRLAADAEPEDVRSGVYGAAFDWDGRRLELEIVEERRRGLGGAPLVLVQESDEEPDAEGLRELLDRSLELMGEVDSLDELRRQALERYGFSSAVASACLSQ